MLAEKRQIIPYHSLNTIYLVNLEVNGRLNPDFKDTRDRSAKIIPGKLHERGDAPHHS